MIESILNLWPWLTLILTAAVGSSIYETVEPDADRGPLLVALLVLFVLATLTLVGFARMVL